MSQNNLHQEFEEAQDWKQTKACEEPGQGSWPLNTSPISLSPESTQSDLQHFI